MLAPVSGPATWFASRVDARLYWSTAHLHYPQWWTYRTPADLKNQNWFEKTLDPLSGASSTLCRWYRLDPPFPASDWFIIHLFKRLVGESRVTLRINQLEQSGGGSVLNTGTNLVRSGKKVDRGEFRYLSHSWWAVRVFVEIKKWHTTKKNET